MYRMSRASRKQDKRVMHKKLSRRFQRAIRDSRSTLLDISRGTGLSYYVLWRLKNARGAMTLRTAQRVANHFGANVTKFWGI